MALDKRQLPEADKKMLYKLSRFRDIDKINPNAWPALVADLSAGDQGIRSLAFGGSMQELQQHTADLSLAVKESTKRVAEDCREGVEKLTQKVQIMNNDCPDLQFLITVSLVVATNYHLRENVALYFNYCEMEMTSALVRFVSVHGSFERGLHGHQFQ
ncbi:hypothetical protein SADUNF_Sadunf15G0123600 [Salix dunnii]|uniref:Uncharacterized protein n=1 Tax=Salix dunnii TaxID=1413687 RepID=A0A835MLL3_9ROSI|nr:hypothetical protein SADUNF_Sadunf15G0123600 [Salix dunnii]